MVRWLGSPIVIEAEVSERDLAALVVSRVGCLEEPREPYRLVSPDGQVARDSQRDGRY